MSKRKENWVEMPCKFCGMPSGAKINTLSELANSGVWSATCERCSPGTSPGLSPEDERALGCLEEFLETAFYENDKTNSNEAFAHLRKRLEEK